MSYILKNIYIHITENCGHRCEYCYAKEGLGGFNNANIDIIKKIVDEAQKANVKTVALVGGDPVLYPHIVEIMQYIKENTQLRVILMTNTACFPKHSAEELSKYIDTVMVTIHGSNAAEHDKICQVPGAYNDLIKNVLAFQNERVAIEVAYNITPYSFNLLYKSIVSLINTGIRPERVALQRIAPSSKYRLNEQFGVNENQVEVALNDMERVIYELKIPTVLVDPFPLCFVKEKHRYLISPCKCGFSDLSINGKGDSSRCGADPSYGAGNILTNSMLDVWLNSKELTDFRNRKYLPKDCEHCDIKVQCAGGCALSCTINNEVGTSHLAAFRKK